MFINIIFQLSIVSGITKVISFEKKNTSLYLYTLPLYRRSLDSHCFFSYFYFLHFGIGKCSFTNRHFCLFLFLGICLSLLRYVCVSFVISENWLKPDPVGWYIFILLPKVSLQLITYFIPHLWSGSFYNSFVSDFSSFVKKKRLF